MLFPTVAFAVFFVAAFTVNWLLRPHFLVWRATMVAFSLYFYGWIDVRFVLILVGSATVNWALALAARRAMLDGSPTGDRSEEHTSELQSLRHLVCRLLLEKKKEALGTSQWDRYNNGGGAQKRI